MNFSILKHPTAQAVSLASATLSAAYYSTQAPAVDLSIAGMVLNPVAIGLGLTAFALDFNKAKMLAVAFTPGRGIVRRFVAGVMFAVLFVASMLAVDGMLARLASDYSAARTNVISKHADALKLVAGLEKEIAALGDPRPVATIQAEISAVHVPEHIWRLSKKCEDITRDKSREACGPVLALYKERGNAARKSELEPKLADARRELEALDPPKSADPQAKAVAGYFGVDEEQVRYGMIALLGFAIELVACFGMWCLMEPPRLVPANDVAPLTTPEKRALDWILMESTRYAGGRMPIENKMLARKFGIDPATATRWRQGWVKAGHVVEQRDGRVIYIKAA